MAKKQKKQKSAGRRKTTRQTRGKAKKRKTKATKSKKSSTKRTRRTKTKKGSTKRTTKKKQGTAKKKAKKKTAQKKTTKKRTKTKRKRSTSSQIAYQADTDFTLFNELQRIILKTLPEVHPKLERALKRVGRIKLAVVTGVFINNEDARIDLLIVGDSIPVQKLTKAIKNIEADLGKEIRYVVLSVSDFTYRNEMHDRFLQDIFEEAYYVLFNRLKIQL